MLTEKEYFLSRKNRCLVRAKHAHGANVASLWREIAESFRLLSECEDREEKQKKPRALLSGRGEHHAVYHFTCTARLPWMVQAGELRPGRNQIGDYPVDFLWATTSRQGDRAASGMNVCRQGGTALIRLALNAEDFEPWPAILDRFPQWTVEHVYCLEAAARQKGETDFTRWCARAEPLPLSRIISAEAKTYTGKWQVIDPHSVCLRGSEGNDPNVRSVLLGDTVYVSIQRVQPGKPTAYTVKKMPLEEWSRSAIVVDEA